MDYFLIKLLVILILGFILGWLTGRSEEKNE